MTALSSESLGLTKNPPRGATRPTLRHVVNTYTSSSYARITVWSLYTRMEQVLMGGPIWAKEIHDMEWVKEILAEVRNNPSR